jgi:hypothetical protein
MVNLLYLASLACLHFIHLGMRHAQMIRGDISADGVGEAWWSKTKHLAGDLAKWALLP